MTQSSPQLQQPGDPEETLRLLAQLPPPVGLADRVHHHLATAPAPSAGFWSLWLPAHRLQFAAAALLVGAVAISSFSLYENRRHPTPTAHSTAPQPASSDSSAFTPSSAASHPSSLKPIKVPPAPHKKPSPTKSRAVRPTAAPPPAN